MTSRSFLLLLLAAALRAQQTVAPAPELVSAPEAAWGNYSVANSFETGYRFSLVDGSVDNYRSTVNYGNGIRLFAGSLALSSQDGHGRYFDNLLITTQGLGNDPYQAVTLRVDKTGLYRYDMTWRLNDYFNPGVITADPAHPRDTERRLQDHELLLLPQSRLKFRLGYSRNKEDGPAVIAVQGVGGGEQSVLPLFTDVRRDWNEYRVGADIDFLGFRFSAMHRWSYYKDDTPYAGLLAGSSVTQFNRSEPYHGSNPAWLGNLTTNRRYWALNARMTYVAGARDFLLNESSTAPGRNGVPAQNQILVGGNASRPFTAGDAAISVFPTDRLTFVNNTAVDSNRIDGNAVITQFNFVNAARTSLNFNYLGVFTVSNASNLQYRLTDWFSLYGGFQYSNRLVSTVSSLTAPGFFPGGPGGPGGGAPGGGAPGGPGGAPGGTGQVRTVTTSDEQKNQQRAGTLGLRIQPFKPVTINLDGEVARNDHPFLPVSDRDYHTIGGRIDYRVKKLDLSTSYRQLYNVNSPGPVTIYSSHSRTFTANAAWTWRSRFSFNASYVKLHLDTAGGIAFFAGTGNRLQLQSGYQSVYVSNVHSGYVGSRIVLSKRADLYLGYNVTRDAGDGRGVPVLPGDTGAQAVLDSVQTFPLSYQTPLARFTLALGPKLRWNAGWQYYHYRQDFALVSIIQNYHANTGYTSIQWSF